MKFSHEHLSSIIYLILSLILPLNNQKPKDIQKDITCAKLCMCFPSKVEISPSNYKKYQTFSQYQTLNPPTQSIKQTGKRHKLTTIKFGREQQEMNHKPRKA